MAETAPIVSVQLVVHNGARFIRRCLDAVRAQTYAPCEVLILDNHSTDGTPDIIAEAFPEYRLIRHDRNLGMWPGQEFLLPQSHGEFVLALSVDVILDAHFIENAVRACILDPSISAVQGKLYQYELSSLEREPGTALTREVIDSCGFGITRSRKVLNLGHGQKDGRTFSEPFTIFGVEGAAPLFRRSSLEACRIDGHIIDPDYFWYGDDLDLAWRMTLFGHRQVFLPDCIAWHDRSTTKGAAGSLAAHLGRIAIRRAIPLHKRRLDWSNVRFTILKNDYIINILRDAPLIVGREIATIVYSLFIEPAVLLELGRFIRLLPRMIRRRMWVMQKAQTPAAVMHHWYQ